jgi:hypothetical protein
MLYKRKNSYAILVASSLIALALVTTTSFNHSYTAFAVSKKTGNSKGNNGFPTLGGISSPSSSSSSSTTTPNSKSLTKKELSSFISCINTANKSEGLTHKVVTNCLDTARGITSATASSTTTSSNSSPSLAPSATSRS